ncbi:hypothetical protein PsorP6_008571 [Peronosclerospora sorghi]|uniref:Uncharacterized protein n=1 Tax=Peronosclerospora sorghi TaxID=230839 RepID=A0ACC0WAX7_9STRA|nr:hypothetical protein PsorP6_008571 [Peronosclerospora sorghi]
MAAANALAMTRQLNQKLPHLNPATHQHQQHQQHQHTQQVVHTHPLTFYAIRGYHLLCLLSHPTFFSLVIHEIGWCQGTNCFPLSSTFSTLSPHVRSQAASNVSASGHVTITPKPLNPATHTASSFRSVPPDPERN